MKLSNRIDQRWRWLTADMLNGLLHGDAEPDSRSPNQFCVLEPRRYPGGPFAKARPVIVPPERFGETRNGSFRIEAPLPSHSTAPSMLDVIFRC